MSNEHMIEDLMELGFSKEQSEMIVAEAMNHNPLLIDNTGLELEQELVKSKKPTKKNQGFKRNKPQNQVKPPKQFKSDKRIPIHKGK